LVCGWDCTGWQRFLYDMSVNNGVLWQPGKYMGISFFYASRVWWALVVMAVFFAPMLLYGYIQFLQEGLSSITTSQQRSRPNRITIIAIIFGMQWVVCLILAIVASLIVMQLNNIVNHTLIAYIIGISIFVLIAYLLLFKQNMIFHTIMKKLYIVEH
jgi:hypothetical protein